MHEEKQVNTQVGTDDVDLYVHDGSYTFTQLCEFAVACFGFDDVGGL